MATHCVLGADKISLKFVAKSPVDNTSALVQVVAQHQTGNKPLPEIVLTKMHDALWPHYGHNG